MGSPPHERAVSLYTARRKADTTRIAPKAPDKGGHHALKKFFAQAKKRAAPGLLLGQGGEHHEQGAAFGPAAVWDTINRERVWAALWLSFRLSSFRVSEKR